jgi:alpha-glucoside transport system substrate-binding protein
MCSWARFTLAGALVGALAVAACTGGSTPPPADGVVRVLASWTDRELDAFRTVLDPFESRTGIRVEYTASRDLPGAIAEALAAGTPPDLAGLAGPNHVAELARQGSLRDLSAAIDVRAYKNSVAPTFIDLGTVDGRLVGVFLRSSVKGLIWYNPRVQVRAAPETWADLELMTVRMNEFRPWCVGLESLESSGWPGTDWIENFLLRQSGPDAYDTWVAGTLPWTSSEVRRAWRAFGDIVAEDAVYGGVDGALHTNFADAGGPLFIDPPGCLFLQQGSFMPTFWQEDGLVAGSDFDFFPFPMIDATYANDVVGGGDLFGLLTDNAAARELIAYLISTDAQSVWVGAGGALSIDQAVTQYPDPISARAAELVAGAHHFRFDASDLMPDELNTAFWVGVLEVTEHPERLDDVLAGLEAMRLELYR